MRRILINTNHCIQLQVSVLLSVVSVVLNARIPSLFTERVNLNYSVVGGPEFEMRGGRFLLVGSEAVGGGGGPRLLTSSR